MSSSDMQYISISEQGPALIISTKHTNAILGVVMHEHFIQLTDKISKEVFEEIELVKRYGSVIVYLQWAADLTGITVDDILSRGQSSPVIMARQLFSLYMKQRGYSYPKIAEFLKQNSATVYNTVNRAKNYIHINDKYFVNAWEQYNAKLQ